MQEKWVDPVYDRVEVVYEAAHDGLDSWKDRIPLDTSVSEEKLNVHPFEAFPFVSDH